MDCDWIQYNKQTNRISTVCECAIASKENCCNEGENSKILGKILLLMTKKCNEISFFLSLKNSV